MEATFCFIDIAGFTALTETHGASTAADLVERFVAIAEDALQRQGSIVDRAGDALFVITPQPDQAVGFVSRLVARALGEADFPMLRAGLHFGEAIKRADSYFGPDVNLAARVSAKATGGQVLATDRVAKVARTQFGIAVSSMGLVALRNIVKPVELFSLALSPEQESVVIDPVCRMRVSPAAAPGRLRFGDRDFWFCSLDCASRFAATPEVFINLL